jgi:glycosyltransferase involved in cell wall biosynthesis
VSKSLKKLWIVSELFYPEETSTSYILTKIANKLCDKYSVNVICGPAVYDLNKPPSSSSLLINNSINIFRTGSLKLNKNILLLRLARFGILSLQLSFAIAKRVSREDKVLIVTNPAPLLLFASVLRYFKKYHLSIIVHDVFPENTIPGGIFKSNKNIFYRVLKFVFDKAYSGADMLIVLGRDMEEIIEFKIKDNKRVPDIHVIENWAEISAIRHLNREQSAYIMDSHVNQIVFQYAGNLGRVQGLIDLLKVIKKVKNPALHFCFAGDGAVKDELISYVENDHLENASFWGSYSRDEQNNILNACDIAIVTLTKGMFGLCVPSKAYNILAAGKPILFIGDKQSEIGKMVEENKIGYCFSPDEQENLISFLQNISFKILPEFKQMGYVSRSLAETRYSEDNILDKYLEVL